MLIIMWRVVPAMFLSNPPNWTAGLAAVKNKQRMHRIGSGSAP